MYKFSLILPTRHRIEPLKRYLKSVFDTVNNKSSIEILVAIDEDDTETIKTIEQLKEQYKVLSLSYYTRPRSEWINKDYYNWLAGKSKGKFIWCNADDLILLVPNWDLIIWDIVNQYLYDKPDRLVCANILDNTPGPGNPPEDKDQFPCFPLFSREVLEANGELLCSNLPTWNADRYAYWLFSKINRFLVINDQLYINHVSYHTKAMESDEITDRAGIINAKYAVIDKHNIHKQKPFIEEQAKKLKTYISTYRF